MELLLLLLCFTMHSFRTMQCNCVGSPVGSRFKHQMLTELASSRGLLFDRKSSHPDRTSLAIRFVRSHFFFHVLWLWCLARAARPGPWGHHGQRRCRGSHDSTSNHTAACRRMTHWILISLWCTQTVVGVCLGGGEAASEMMDVVA